ncbi:hypothetical protein [Aeromonas salmonicida]|uniref:hypothetical protein n=1 Tax=Aeromonas salmonicida TaxID=645 RepID=UPI003D1D12C7
MNLDHSKHILEHIQKSAPWASKRNHYFNSLCAAEFHWFFVQGLDAIEHEFYVPGVSSLLNGVEASLRVTIAQITSGAEPLEELSPYRVLSNNLILNALDLGLPIDALAFPGENDFQTKLISEKPNRVDVEIVRQRNNICHGNILEFINKDLGPENAFFTPESMKPLALTLLDITQRWAEELGAYRSNAGLLHYATKK